MNEMLEKELRGVDTTDGGPYPVMPFRESRCTIELGEALFDLVSLYIHAHDSKETAHGNRCQINFVLPSHSAQHPYN